MGMTRAHDESAMKRWAETREVLDAKSRWQDEGKRTALATVVKVIGAAGRREGAKLLIAEDGRSCGSISGGRLEEDVREAAIRVIGSRIPEVRSYAAPADAVEAWNLGVDVEGRVDVYITPGHVRLGSDRALLESERPFVMATLLEGEPRRSRHSAGGFVRPLRPSGPAPWKDYRLLVTEATVEGLLGDAALDAAAIAHARSLIRSPAARSGIHDILETEVFFDVYSPPPHLVILGGDDDARSLADLGVAAGFRVYVADREPTALDPQRFHEEVRLVRTDPTDKLRNLPLGADSFVVLMTRDYDVDLAYLNILLPLPLAYVGVAGSRARTERLLTSILAERPLDASVVYGPVGLDIGGEGAEATAISVIGEMMSVRFGRRGSSLRDGNESIRAPSR